MSAPATPESTPLFAPDPLLHDLLAVSLTAINLLRPCYSSTGELDDFTPEYFNPAAQRMTGLPERPVGTARTLFPDIFTNGIFAFYRQVFETGKPDQFQRYYQADGLDNYFRIAARRSGERLWVSFTDTADQSRTPAENALRDSLARERAAHAEAEAERQRFQDVLMQLPAQVAINRGPDHVFTLVNAPYQQMFPTRPVQGLPVRQALPELEGQQFFDLLDHVYQTGEPFYSRAMPASVDFTNSGNLERRYVDVFFQALHDAQGRVDGILNFSYDVTEQVRARQQVQTLNEELAALNEELRASNEEYQQTNAALGETQQQQQLEAARAEAEAERQRLYQVLMRMPANIALLRGPEHIYDLVNAEYERLFPARTTLGRTIREVIPDIEGQGFYELFDRVYETGEPFYQAETEAWANFTDTGELQRRYYRTTLEPIRDAQGQVTEVLNFAVDVTTQVEARQQVEQLNTELEARVQARTADLQESEGRFRTMADTAPAILWVTDPDGQCTYLNAQWYQYTGQTEAEALGMGWTQAVHPEDAALAGQKFLDANAQRTPFYIRYRLRRHDGVYRWAVDAGRPHFAEDGAYAGIVGTVIDIHEQQLAEGELIATNEQLWRTNVDLDNFIYTASHDLKAPITNIEGLLLALEHELPDAARTGDVPLMLTMMQDAVDRFRRTITHLTDLSRLQKEHNPASDAVALAPVVEAVRLDLTPLLTQTQGQLTVSIPQNLTVTFAEKNLRSVVYNLLSNAFKYRHPDRVPEVQLRSWLADDYAVLEVQDNGLGLDLAQGQDKLFAMFQRLHSHVEGTGVGLYMVKRIVENAGGHIEVTSQLGQGSTFRVYFPR